MPVDLEPMCFGLKQLLLVAHDELSKFSMFKELYGSFQLLK